MDKKFLLTTINLSKKNLGITSPNPTVGCIIVKNGEILSTGITSKGGRPHAENVAINKVIDKNKLIGATLYVSLEPCCHFGQTSPCTDIIIESKISRVVIAAIDSDGRVNGKGIEKLRQNGVKVDIIELDEAFEINKGFFKAKRSGLPYITLKLATSLDGKIATKSFESKWITGGKARKFAHYLRSINDAILIGAQTLKYDDPALDCRIFGLEEYSPKRFVITNRFNFDENYQIFRSTKKIPTTILANKNLVNQKNLEKFKNLGVEIISCEEKNDIIDLKLMLEKICESGINSILIEGGQNLATQLLRENLVDELIWIQNQKIIGSDGISAIGEFGFQKIDDVFDNFKRQRIEEIDEKDFVSFYKKIV